MISLLYHSLIKEGYILLCSKNKLVNNQVFNKYRKSLQENKEVDILIFKNLIQIKIAIQQQKVVK